MTVVRQSKDKAPTGNRVDPYYSSVIPWFRILAFCKELPPAPPPLRKNRSEGRVRVWTQDPGFYKQAKISGIRELGLPYTEAITFTSQPCLFLIWNIVVNLQPRPQGFSLKNGWGGKGPGIGWSRPQPKYSWKASLYATRWFCADRSR